MTLEKLQHDRSNIKKSSTQFAFIGSAICTLVALVFMWGDPWQDIITTTVFCFLIMGLACGTAYSTILMGVFEEEIKKFNATQEMKEQELSIYILHSASEVTVTYFGESDPVTDIYTNVSTVKDDKTNTPYLMYRELYDQETNSLFKTNITLILPAEDFNRNASILSEK